MLDKRPALEYLVGIERNTGAYIPELAEKWEMAPDGKTPPRISQPPFPRASPQGTPDGPPLQHPAGPVQAAVRSWVSWGLKDD
jgi:hypothetical protein